MVHYDSWQFTRQVRPGFILLQKGFRPNGRILTRNQEAFLPGRSDALRLRAIGRSERGWHRERSVSAARGVQLLFDAEDEGRAAAGKLQRWGLEALV